MFLQGKTKDKG